MREVLLSRIESAERIRPPIRMSSSSIHLEHLALAGILHSSGDFSDAKVKALRTAAMRCPPPTGPVEQATLDSHGDFAQLVKRIPSWAKDIAKCREHFFMTGLEIETAGGVFEYVKFCYAVQQEPMYVGFVRMTPRSIVFCPTVVTSVNWGTRYMQHVHFAFDTNFLDFLAADDLRKPSRN